MKIAMTGVSGNMGKEALKQTMELQNITLIRVLLENKRGSIKLAKALRKIYGQRIDILIGSIHDTIICKKLVSGMDYVVHMAAVIPPSSDASAKNSFICNALGAVALVNAIKKECPQPKYIHISTVALYGFRNEKHPFGRVGDPLLVSAFDAYAKDKLSGERYVLDSKLQCWVVLRQTAMLHPNMLKDNISDGLMFHTSLNAPLEWVSSRDSGYLIKRILERDYANEIPQFWRKIYNIGAGYGGRCTGYDTFNAGFAIIGGSAEKYFKPHWFSPRNFHGLWFADGNELNNLFHYQRDDFNRYWKEIANAHCIYSLGKFVPKSLLYIFLFRRLLNHSNSPQKWLKNDDTARINAFYGGKQNADSLPRCWEEMPLIAKGDFGNYEELRKTENAKLLSHGYDESKAPEQWTLDDLQQAASFRGGKCLATALGKDEYEKVLWQCAEGHIFESSPYTILRGGHWCPECCLPSPWRFDKLAKIAPFYAQVWYDSHSENENMAYAMGINGNVTVYTED